jgi:hypothetical protein
MRDIQNADSLAPVLPAAYQEVFGCSVKYPRRFATLFIVRSRVHSGWASGVRYTSSQHREGRIVVSRKPGGKQVA